MNAPHVGLCAACRYARILETRRGARFWLCQRSRTDPSYPRYPSLPVLACAGFEFQPVAPGQAEAP